MLSDHLTLNPALYVPKYVRNQTVSSLFNPLKHGLKATNLFKLPLQNLAVQF